MSLLDIANMGEKDERIAARRRRAEAKLRRDREEAEGATGGNAAGDASLLAERQGIGKAKVSEASAILERLNHDTTRDLTGIQVKFDNEENERRIIEENARLDR